MRLEFFRMIDGVLAFDRAGKRIETRSVVPEESPVFEGHFPGHPLVPGVLLTETMAQASGYLILGVNDFAIMPFLMSVDRARFRTFVEPKAELTVTAEIVHEGSGYVATKAAMRSDGKPIADAELRFRTLPFPAGLGDQMRSEARRIGLPAGDA